MTYRAFDDKDVPVAWTVGFSIPDAQRIEELDEETRAIVERYVRVYTQRRSGSCPYCGCGR